MTDHQEYLYPLCYIPGIRGSRVKYTTTDELCLLDIGNIETVRYHDGASSGSRLCKGV
jgi:hypothetical protein